MTKKKMYLVVEYESSGFHWSWFRRKPNTLTARFWLDSVTIKQTRERTDIKGYRLNPKVKIPNGLLGTLKRKDSV